MDSGFQIGHRSYYANPLSRMRYVDAFDYDNVTGILTASHSTGQRVPQDIITYIHDVKAIQPGWMKAANFALVVGSQIAGMAILPGMREIVATCGSGTPYF